MSILAKAEDVLKQANALVLRNGASKANQAALGKVKEDARSIIVEAAAPVEPPKQDIFYGTELADYFHQGGMIEEVAAPDGSGEKVFLLHCSDTDGIDITSNPRSEMNTGGHAAIPQEFWWAGAFWLPTTFPAEVPGWWNLLEGPYGPPYAGSPPVEISLGGKNVLWNRNATGSYKNVWSRPYTRGKKNSFLIHVVQSASKGANGLVEMWLNGEQVCSVAVPTLDATNYQGPQALYLQSYRQKGMFRADIPIYHWPLKAGTTRASVEG